ncbi:FKBP-type peptidyl-prolyl cis-trans isomerase SlyD [termite gut metagenome]|uniref:peptidylprolyl isomerase n=1 Tax=termite gut metagenome TaxID=433724 RepID=A0A5J4S517_9ZZZZ
METENKCITVAYKLYATADGERELIEEATEKHPFRFITDLGTTLDVFENQIKNLNKGDKFEFTVPCANAYGEYNEEHVIDVPKNIFEVDGHFDAEAFSTDKIIPLINADGQRIYGSVVEVLSDTVVMDMNHPLAGDDLTFIGKVIESRIATGKEIEEALATVNGEGCCGCHDGDCESGCECNGCR